MRARLAGHAMSAWSGNAVWLVLWLTASEWSQRTSTAQLMSNWAARDAACHQEKTESDQQDKILNRAVTVCRQMHSRKSSSDGSVSESLFGKSQILVQFYGKALGPGRRNGEVEMAGELEIEVRCLLRCLGAVWEILPHLRCSRTKCSG
jgi:hypothetical protein